VGFGSGVGFGVGVGGGDGWFVIDTKIDMVNAMMTIKRAVVVASPIIKYQYKNSYVVMLL